MARPQRMMSRRVTTSSAEPTITALRMRNSRSPQARLMNGSASGIATRLLSPSLPGDRIGTPSDPPVQDQLLRVGVTRSRACATAGVTVAVTVAVTVGTPGRAAQLGHDRRGQYRQQPARIDDPTICQGPPEPV